MENEICHLNLEDIIPNIDIPQQKNDYIEQELVESIKKHGILQPIIVKKNNNKYDIVDKAQGKKKAITNIVNMISECSVNIADYPIIIGYLDDETNAEFLKNSLIKQFGEDTIVLLQKFNKTNANLFGDNSLIVSFYSKKLNKAL